MSVDQIKKFLESATDYPDNTPIRIGDQEIPLGSLRQLNSAERNSLSERMKAVESKETELNGRQATIVDLAQKAQQAYAAAEEARKTATVRTPELGNDPFNDPWLAPVKAALSERDKKIEELTGQLKTAVGTIQSAATVWAQDRWDREYSNLNFGKREKKPTRDELLKFATDNNLTDRHKMPSISAAWEKMSEADRQADIAAEAREKGREEGRMEALAARVTPPGVSGIGQGPAALPRAVNPGSDVLGDLYAEALKDQELRGMIENLPTGLM